MSEFLTDLTEAGLCAIIRCKAPGVALPIARTLVEAGVRILEVTLTTPDAEETIAELAHDQGATAVKIFPASSGGPAHMKALRDPLPKIPLVAVGGVGLAEIPQYRAVGAIGFGVGGPLIGDAAVGGSLAALAERAAAFVEVSRS